MLNELVSNEDLQSTIDTTTDAAPLAAEAGLAPEAAQGFALLNLSAELLQAVKDMGFTQPTPVQERVIPLAMSTGDQQSWQDLMVSSQTGSGKTAAFLLPLLHMLIGDLQDKAETEAKAWAAQVAQALAQGKPEPKKPRRHAPADPRHFKPATPGALVLCPTRELAQQVAHDAIDLARHVRGVRIAAVVGGMPYAQQIARLQNANLVVATPGRLLDLQNSGQIRLQGVQSLVVDEADRMLDLGFAEDLENIHQLTAQRRQTLMFSATFAPRIQQLAERVMRTPQRLAMTHAQDKHQNIQQSLYWADNASHKRELLNHWLRDPAIDQAIVFASTQIECDSLAAELQEMGYSAVGLHGALSQGLRNRRLMALRQGRVQFLVATDVAARGIDVPTISHVFNYGLPMKSEDYVHRIGRTGRAGRDGQAITLAEFRDRRKILDIEHYTQQRFQAKTITGLEPTQAFDRPTHKPKASMGRRPGGNGGNGSKPWARSGAPARKGNGGGSGNRGRTSAY